jgi:hypothetical protein
MRSPALLGLQKIVDLVLEWPAAFGYFLLALGTLFLLGWAASRVHTIEDAHAQAPNPDQF